MRRECLDLKDFAGRRTLDSRHGITRVFWRLQ